MVRMNITRLAFLLTTALLVASPRSVHADDDAPDAPDAPQKAPAVDPVKAQLFADKEAEDALGLVQQAGIVEVQEGLERLSRVSSSKVTEDIVKFALARSELHVAEFAGYALAKADPEGALDLLAARLQGAARLETRQLVQAAGLLSELPAPRSVELLAGDRLLHARNAVVRREALRALGWLRSPEAVTVALDALGSKDGGLRNVACVALGRIGDARAVPALLRKLDMSDDDTGSFAAIALGRIESDDVFPNIAARMSKGDKLTKGKALVAAARPRHVPKLASMAKSGSRESKIAACAALGKIGEAPLDVQAIVLNVMLGDSDRWVRAAAFHALGAIATRDLAPALAKRMGQRDNERKMYVYEIAGDIRAKECLPEIENAVWNEKHPILARVAISAFWRIADPEAITRVEAKIRKAKGRLMRRVMPILGLRANRNGFDLALELLEQRKEGSKDEFQVELALEKLTGHFFGNDPAVWKEWIEANPNFFEKEQAAVERAKWHEDFMKENKGPRVTPATELTVQRALDYLARHQNPSGAFDQQHFMDLCSDNPCPASSGARVQMDPVGMTGLGTLAFFGAGYGPESGRYRGVLARAMEYLLARQQPRGDYAANDLIGGYNRPIALQAFAEAYLATNDAQYLPFVQRGVDFLAVIQADKGGWRYRVVDNASDSSVVAWVLFAAKAAEKAHARVRGSIFEGSDLVLSAFQKRPIKEREDFYRDIDPNYAFEVGQGTKYEFHTGYQDTAFQANQATTALGLMSRILLGYRRSHPFCIGSANKILAEQLPELPKNGNWDRLNINAQYPMYFMYYGTLAMHQMGGRYFREWNKVIKEILPSTQDVGGCARGSWNGTRADGLFSRLYTTAMGALTLETYYRYAPILQD